MRVVAQTARQQREAAYYREYVRAHRVEHIDFEPVDRAGDRPWNPYWYAYELACRRFVSPQQRLLDFGCGQGVAAVRLAHVGYRVDGFDISDDNIEVARDLAHRYGLERRCRFDPMAAEALAYDDQTFDVVVGIDILHHVDIPRAVAEARRVLKPGGIAIFKEHIETPGFEPIRNSRLMCAIAPKEVSLDHHITEDERKLTAGNVRSIRDAFDDVKVDRFTILSRLDRLAPDNERLRARLQQVDHRLQRLCPPLRRLGGTVVMTCGRSVEDGRCARRAAA